jgi:hypothetical protein
MSTTVYLAVKNLGGVIEHPVILLINERNKSVSSFTPMLEGSTWGDLKQSFINSASEKGRGSEIIKFKDGLEHWILPFRDHPLMSQPNPADACVMTSQELKDFEWDIIEEAI